MKTQISLAAKSLDKGSYVLVKYGKDNWFAGTVTTVKRAGGYVVTFNEGTKVSFEAATKLKPILKKGKKAPYSDVEAKLLVDAAKQKTISKKPKVTVRVTKDNIATKPTTSKPKQLVIIPDTVYVNGIALDVEWLASKAVNYTPKLPQFALRLRNKEVNVSILIDPFIVAIETYFAGNISVKYGWGCKLSIRQFPDLSPTLDLEETKLGKTAACKFYLAQVMTLFQDTNNLMWKHFRNAIADSVTISDSKDLLDLAKVAPAKSHTFLQRK